MQANWQSAQEAEISTWNIPDEVARLEKIERETARYPKLIKDMGLDRIDLRNKRILEIGGGPVGVIADIHCAHKVILDPLADEYKTYFECPYHVRGVGEALPFESGSFDIVLISNALDHCQSPEIVLWEAKRVLRAGGWLAMVNCTYLKYIHKHPGHIHSLDEMWFHNLIDTDFETVHESTFKRDGYRYGWVKYHGIVGQPAWAGLYRKTSGYISNNKEV